MIDTLIIIAPVFAIILLGYFLGRTRLFDTSSVSTLMAFVTYVAVPALLFKTIGGKTFPGGEELSLVGAYYGALFIIYGTALLIGRLVFRQSGAEQSVFAFTVCFANGLFLGIPVLEGLYGDEGVRLLLIILSFHTVSMLPLSTILLEKAKAGKTDTPVLIVILKSMWKNPILMALAISLVWSALSLPIPVWLDRLVSLPASAAAPVGLFTVGLALSGVRIKGDLPQAFTAVCLKLCILPLTVFVSARFVFDLPDIWVGTATAMAALPSGMIPYQFASQHGVGERRAATTVLVSTVTSFVSLNITFLILKAGGY